MPERTDEFYIGYLPQVPPGHAARTRMAVLAVLILAVGVALILVTGQERFGTGVFEFGITKNFQGVILERPYPVLLVEPDGGGGSFSSYLLVVYGKRGAADLVGGMDGEPVKLQGSLIHREGWAMIEVARPLFLTGENVIAASQAEQRSRPRSSAPCLFLVVAPRSRWFRSRSPWTFSNSAFETTDLCSPSKTSSPRRILPM